MPDETLTEEEVDILRRAGSDPAEFAPLYERYYPRIYGYCYRRVGRPAEAEDLSSQVFTRALGGLKGYRGGSVAAWLFQIAHNVVVNHLQARQRRPQVSLENDENLFREEELGGVEDGTLEQLIQVEERQQIARLIAALPAEQRELLLLKLVDRLSAKEIGAMLGKSEGAVRIAIYRIMQQLRASYEQLDKEQAG